MSLRKVLWGLFFLIAAVLVVMSQLSIFPNVNLLALAGTVLLVAVIIESLRHLAWGGILFPLAFIAMIYTKPLGIEALSPWTLLVVALFATIGLHILFGRRFNGKISSDKINHEHFDNIINDPDGDHVSFSVKFSSAIKYVNTKSLKQANFECSFGALKVYFDQAEITAKEAQIYINAKFSGVELYLPKGWNIVNNLQSSFGGTEEKNANIKDPDGPVVTIVGNVDFAGLEIVYV